jgi:hypothetical protein
MIPRVEPEGMLFREPVSTPDQVRGRLFRDHALTGDVRVNEQPRVGVVPLDVLLSYDGLSFLQALIAGELPAPPITQTLGFTLAEAEKKTRGVRRHAGLSSLQSPRHRSRRVCRDAARIGGRLLGSHHAGQGRDLYDARIQDQSGAAAHRQDRPGPGGRPRAHRGRTVATAEGDLKDSAGKLYAHATTTCAIFPPGSMGKIA